MCLLLRRHATGSQCEEQRLREVVYCTMLPEHGIPVSGSATLVSFGNQVHYADGSTARIVSGLTLVDNREFEPLAFVGSELDNGDTITDSPEREGLASACTFTPVKRSTMARQGDVA
ncbi:hypothetical protein [Burkholderia ambifaria]|uniref:Uncharacterized protein n=1 Tax=Burkholderia ambifaria MEX-5 TaxID=396597 RepID=B1T1T3_9BURK|nr:hypothetical protein [Burkholderia ambifaria]EDT42460.1 hypothetical protein BamMEX5DRAFT_1749 [Burkholderia ambifaria MEX-5]